MGGWYGPAMVGTSAAAGYLGNRPKTATEDELSTSTLDSLLQKYMEQYTDTSRRSTSVETPTMDPLQARMRDQILNAYRQRMATDPDMRGYMGQGLRDINSGADIQRQAMESRLSTSGMRGSAAGQNALGNIDNSRISEGTRFMGGIPLLKRELQLKDLAQFGNFFSSLPTGRTTNTAGFDSSRMTGMDASFGQNRTNSAKRTSTTDPGNPWAGLFSGLGQGLAAGYGQKAASPKGEGPNEGTGEGSSSNASRFGPFAAIAAALPWLFGGGRSKPQSANPGTADTNVSSSVTYPNASGANVYNPSGGALNPWDPMGEYWNMIMGINPGLQAPGAANAPFPGTSVSSSVTYPGITPGGKEPYWDPYMGRCIIP